MTEEQFSRLLELKQKQEDQTITYAEMEEMVYLCRVGLAEMLGCTYE